MALNTRQAQTETTLPSNFNFPLAFSAHLYLGKPLPSIAVPGGALVAEPITNGVGQLRPSHYIYASPRPTTLTTGTHHLPPVSVPYNNSTVPGPATNATITGGIATPPIFNNGSIQAPAIQAWGLTSDGFGFVIKELCIGSPKGQVTRIQMDVGGGQLYESLRNEYVLASVKPNATQTEGAINAYLVANNTETFTPENTAEQQEHTKLRS